MYLKINRTKNANKIPPNWPGFHQQKESDLIDLTSQEKDKSYLDIFALIHENKIYQIQNIR